MIEINTEEKKIIRIIKEIGLVSTALDIWYHGSYEFNQTTIDYVLDICYEMIKKGILEEYMPNCFNLKNYSKKVINKKINQLLTLYL